MTANQISPRQELIDQVLVLLGNDLVDLDIEFKNVNVALTIALEKYRQRSSNAVQESIFFLSLQPEVQTYTLPEEITEVVAIWRRGLSANVGQSAGNQYDPFALAYTNLYLLQPTGQGDLGVFALYSDFLKEAAKLFGGTYDFRWDERTHKLTIFRMQQVLEDCLIQAYMRVSDDALIKGTYSRPWIRDYTTAKTKMLLGNAYEHFSSLPGPSGTIVLNGAQLKAEAEKEMALLEEAINKYTDGSRPLGFLIG